MPTRFSRRGIPRVSRLTSSNGGGGGGARSLLASSDLTYLGKIRVDKHIGESSGGGELQYGQGFTGRYRNGQLYFLTLGYKGFGAFGLNEFACPATLESTVSTASIVWSDISLTYDWHGIEWDEDEQILISTSAIDYPNDEQATETKTIRTRTLNSNGTISNLRGVFGLSAINGRRVYGACTKIPAWFQTQHSLPPYLFGFGGYASRLAAGGLLSLGPTAYAVPDPRGYADNSEIPTNDYTVLMDHSSGSTTVDWYSGGVPTTFDRGARFNTNVSNEYDAGVYWHSPSPDGKGRFVWGDTLADTGVWIDNDAGTRSKHAFTLTATLATGRAWYQASSLNCESKGAEIQFFNPDHLAEVKNGTRQQWAVQPYDAFDLTPYMSGHTWATFGYLLPGGVNGAWIDKTTWKLYVYLTFCYDTGYDSTILVFQVGGS